MGNPNFKSQRDQIGTWGRINKRRLANILHYAGTKILDTGCSTGAYVGHLRANQQHCYGVDIIDDPVWLNSSISPYVTVADVYRLPFADKSFDTICSFEVMEHLPHPQQALQEFIRVARQNIIISVPNCEQPPIFQKAGITFHHHVDKTHQQFFTKKTLSELLQRENFSIKHFEYINPISPEALCLSAWHLPAKLASFLGRIFHHLPLRKKYYMTMLVVAEIA